MEYESRRVQSIKPSAAITISTRAKAMRAAGEPVIDLSIGEPDFDTPDNVIEAAVRAMKRGETRYTPPDGTPALKDAVVEKFRRENGLSFDRDRITCANGAKQVIFNALMATLEPDDEVICPAPYWISYTDMTLLVGGRPKVVECAIGDDFKLTPDRLEAALTPRSRWLMLNSPSNPSGTTYSAGELRALGEVIARHPRLMVMSDEIYEQIYFGDAPFVSFATACPDLQHRTIVVNGVAKTYAMTGWRIGYAAAPAPLAAAMRKIQSQSTSNPCSISQAAAVEALTGPQAFVEAARDEFRARRDQVVADLERIPGLELLAPKGAFYVFPRLAAFIGRTAPGGKSIEDDGDLTAYLLDTARVAGVPGAAFGLSPYLRLSFACSRADLKTAVGSISDALSGLN